MRKNVVIFDLDETIGYFSQLSVFMSYIEVYLNREFTEKEFKVLLDIFPEVFRPDIFIILNYLKQEKKKNKNLKVIIYTNNNGPKQWTYSIKRYIENKINSKIFDRSILAWKVDGNQYEKCRTTHNKTYNDLLRCGKFSKRDKFCFLDDAYHKKMIHKQIYYINLYKYKHKFSYEEMFNRLLNSKLDIINKQDSKKILSDIMEDNSNRFIEQILKRKYDKKEILNEIKLFLNKNRLTRKNKLKTNKRKTFKVKI